MNQETFQIFLWVMSAVALVVFIALYFVKAGYGMFRTASWGISINNKLAWVLMEAPVFIVMFGLWGKSGAGFAVPVYFFFLLFQLHYLQRAFIFPFLLKGKSRMPVAIMAMGIVFNLLNGMMQAGGLFYFAPEGLYACLLYTSIDSVNYSNFVPEWQDTSKVPVSLSGQPPCFRFGV